MSGGVKAFVIVSCLLLQSPIKYPFDDPSAEWIEAKKIGLVQLANARPLMSHAPPTLQLEKLNEKSVGHLDRYIFKLQVADKTNMRLLPISAIDAIHPEQKRELAKHDLWLTNYPTANLVDQDTIVLIGAIKVVGTKTYDAAFGQRTVRMIEFLPKDQALTMVKKIIDDMEKDKKALEDAKYLTFKSKVGTEVVAKFEGYKNGKILLKTKDGRDLKLSIDVFADESVKELRELIREYRAKK